MSLKQLTFNQKREIQVNSIIDQLISIKTEIPYLMQKICYYAIDILYESSFLNSKDIDPNVEYIYGVPDNKEDLEWKMAKILFLYYLFFKFKQNSEIAKSENRINILLHNIKIDIKRMFEIDYKIYWPEKTNNIGIHFIKYESIETKTIIDNLSDIPEKFADPIAELLKPMKTEDELIGLISKTHSKIENIKPEKLKNLNDTDKSIAKNAKKFAQQIINNVEAAKGHYGKSQLSIKDIVHNYALNISLLHKLVELDKDNENKEKEEKI